MEQRNRETTAPGDGIEDRDKAPEEDRRLAPRVWVASLSDYNAGRLHGAWVDADDEATLWEGIRSVLVTSPEVGAEEWAFHDYEGFGAVRLHEYESAETVARLAAGIAAHGPAFSHYASLTGWADPERLEHFEAAYQGHFDSLTEYGEQLIESYDLEDAITALPELLIPYTHIDAEAFARDMELGGTIMTSEGDGGIYVFEAD